MTIKNKIVASVIAAAFTTTSAFAGTLTTTAGIGTDGQTLIAQELTDGGYTAALNTMTYTADINGSTTVSDAAVLLGFPDTTKIVKDNAADLLAVVDTVTNTVVALETSTNANNQVVFDSDSAFTFSDGKAYSVQLVGAAQVLGNTPVTAAGTGIGYTGTTAELDAMTMTLELWSTSGTEVMRDTATLDPFETAPQYSVYCDNKLNNLINVENSSLTFVATNHGAEVGIITDSGAIDTDFSGTNLMETLTDVLRFTVKKSPVDIGLDGRGSRLVIHPSNDLDLVVDAAASNSDFADSVVGNANVAFDGASNDIIVTDAAGAVTPFEGTAASETTFTVNLAVLGTAAIPATTFTAEFDVADTTAGAGFTPAGEYTANSVIGSWEDFSYMAQIAGATETSITKTKLFVANRSCKTVTPVVTLIQDGKTVDINMSPVAADSQLKESLGDVIAANEAAVTAAGITTTGNFAIEITIPGNAEDFYVYAQAFNATDKITKDLPVYNTSTRD